MSTVQHGPVVAESLAPCTRDHELFFTMSAVYVVVPGASLGDLVSDGRSLLSSALGVLREMEIDSDALFAVLHLLEQSESVIALAGDMLDEQELRELRSEVAGDGGTGNKTGGAA